jgi:PAS domain S-box-containing protein
MGGNLRTSGIEIIGDVPWGTHLCQFNQTKEDLMDILTPYFRAGLENNEFCFWGVSQASGVEEAKEALRGSVSDIDAYLEKGQMEIASCSPGSVSKDAFNSEKIVSGWILKLNQALANGFSGLRVAVDTSWLKGRDPENLANYEKKVNSVLRNHNIIALCLYSLDTCSAADIIEGACNHQFALIKREGKWARIENSGRKSFPAKMPVGETLIPNGQRNSLKLENAFSPEKEKTSLELADIIDVPAIQSLMDDFYEFALITIGIVDLKGNVLVSNGWQDICTRFHRVHPEACKHCVESDTNLSAGVPPGEFKLYRCRNNMWDTATPIMVGGQHVGNIFSGQFFFEDEPLDYELFRAQARKYGFNEEEYIAALEKVPRLSSKVVATGMAFFAKLANMLSQLSYSNIKLSQSLAERDALMGALRESGERLRLAQQVARIGTFEWNIQTGVNTWTPELEAMYGLPRGGFPGTEEAWEQLVYQEDRAEAIRKVNEAIDKGSFESEWRVVWPDGSVHWLYGRAFVFRDESGKPLKLTGINIDITERKQEEHRIRRYNRILEGINRIFGNVVQAKTEEDVGNACLSVALEVTGSKFGFINEMGAGGLLHDVAKSELAWEQCLMYDKAGHRRPPNVFAVHGLYGSVINNEKGFFTNDPLSHPDSIGLPPGHPPITSFLGVPLVQEGKTIGLIAVANREGGYSCEQQQDLEAIAPAVVQTLQRKKAEEALKKAYDNLEEIIEERTVQLEKAYNSLKESEKGLAEAQKMAHIGNWEWDIAADKAYWSEETYCIFGRDPKNAAPSYNEYLSYIHPDDLANYCSATQNAVMGKPFGIDYRIVLDNGEVRTVHLKSEFVLDNKNIPIRVKGTVQDITERKKSEEQIQVLANIVKSSNDAIGTISLEDIITSCNEEVERVYGYSAEEIIGKPTSFVAPPHLFEETKRLSELIKQGKRIHHYETSRLRKDGKFIDVSITLSPVFDSYGKLAAISFISRDISERKRVEEKLRESEEKYRNIVETANEGIFIIDAEATVTYANKKLTDILGYTQEEVLGRVIWDFVSEESKVIIRLHQERRRQGINESYELKFICKGGASLWALVNSKSLFDTDRKFMGSISMLTDITERKEAEEALANVETIRKKEIHHRIKNNLQVISSLLDLQAEKFRDKEVLEAFRESQNRVLSMSLIHEELYRGEGTDTLNFSAYLQKLANNLFQTYSLRSKNLHLLMDLENNAFFNMDIAIPLGIIVNELISNSLKHAFIEGGEGEIRIRLCRDKINGKTHESLFSLIISDNGTGIPGNIEMECVESLGLQLVSILVDQLDGKLELKQEHGTEFWISFRVVESPLAPVN